MIEVSVAQPLTDFARQATRTAVLAFIRTQGTFGATADEVAIAFGSSHNHVAPRITELKKSTIIVSTPFRRKTRSGAYARVLIAS